MKRFVLLWSKVAEHFVLEISELFCWKSLLFRGIFCFEFWRWGDYFFHPPGASESCSLGSWQNETDLNWLKNQEKMVGEREILASLVEFKQHSMAETIRNEKEEKKLKPRGQVWRKKDTVLSRMNDIFHFLIKLWRFHSEYFSWWFSGTIHLDIWLCTQTFTLFFTFLLPAHFLTNGLFNRLVQGKW